MYAQSDVRAYLTDVGKILLADQRNFHIFDKRFRLDVLDENGNYQFNRFGYIEGIIEFGKRVAWSCWFNINPLDNPSYEIRGIKIMNQDNFNRMLLEYMDFVNLFREGKSNKPDLQDFVKRELRKQYESMVLKE